MIIPQDPTSQAYPMIKVKFDSYKCITLFNQVQPSTIYNCTIFNDKHPTLKELKFLVPLNPSPFLPFVFYSNH